MWITLSEKDKNGKETKRAKQSSHCVLNCPFWPRCRVKATAEAGTCRHTQITMVMRAKAPPERG